MAIKRDVRDKLFSDLVRERAEWNCERCGTHYPEGKRQGLHCAHIVGRSTKSTRWHPLNAFALCYGCHQYFTGQPAKFNEFVLEQLGEPREKLLRTVYANRVFKWKKFKDELTAHLKRQWRNMQDKRTAGQTGRIEFEAFEE